MLLNRWTPEAPIRAFDRFNRLMDEFLTHEDPNLHLGWLPSVDVKETDREYTFVAELPGMDEEDIRVELVGDILTIKGEREFEKEERKEDYLRIERGYGSFHRSFPINSPIKPNAITAKFENGLLCVTVPKSEDLGRHQIRVVRN